MMHCPLIWEEIDVKKRILGVLFFLLLLAGSACAETLVMPESTLVIEKEAFYQAENVASVVLPNGVEKIGERAFAQSGLRWINLPQSVTEIAADAFADCPDLSADVVMGSYAHQRCNELGILCNFDGYAPATAFAWTSDGSSVTITDYLDSAPMVNVPREIAGLPVKAIGPNALSNLSQTRKISIPDGVTTLENNALRNCPVLEAVVLPESLTYIGSYAMAQCPALASVNLPQGLKTIVNHAFDGCSSLGSIALPESLEGLGSYAFYNCTSLQSLEVPSGIDQVEDYLCYGCTSLTSVSLPEGVRRIGSYAFQGCTALTTVHLPSALKEIGSYAFRDCYKLNVSGFPNGLEVIGTYAFNKCDSLTAAILPDSVRSIGNFAFSWCAQLKTVRLPVGLETLNEYMFTWDTSLSSITWPSNLKTIQQFAFAYTNLPEIHLPDTVQSIGSHCFYNGLGVTSIILPGSLSCVSDHAFVRCNNMTSLVFEEGVQSISSYAFAENYAIEHVDFPASMRDIGLEAFRGCEKLSSVTFCNSPISISSNVFSRTSLSGEIVIPDQTGYYSNSFGGRPVTLVRFTDKIRSIAENTMLSLMEGVHGPEILFGNVSADGVTWYQHVVNAAVAFAGGNLSDMNTPVKKRAFLINDAMEIAGGSKQVTFIDTKKMSKALEHLNSGAELTDDYTFEIIAEMSRSDALEQMTSADVVEIYKEFAKGAAGTADALKNAGVAEEAVSGVMQAFDTLKKLGDIADVISTLSGALDACSQVVDVFNQIQFLDTLDKQSLAQTARVYMASSDSAVRDAGSILQQLSTAGRNENIALIATGKIKDCGLSYVIDGAVSMGSTAYLNGPVMATATVTTAIMDLLTGVGDVPRLVNEVTYAADAADESYAQFQKELAAYKASPSTATFGLAAWDYIIYCEAAAQSQDAFISLYEHLDNAAAIELSDELSAVVDAARTSMGHLQKRAENGRQVYALWQSGDVDAFQNYINGLHKPDEAS